MPDIQNPMAVFVKGGTSTSRNDERLEREFQDAERRRDRAAREKALSRVPIEQGGALQHEANLRGPQGATYVPIWYVDRYGNRYAPGIADIVMGTTDDPLEVLIILICPRCAMKKPHLQDCVVKIQRSNRNFEFRPHVGKFFLYDDGDGPVRYRSAGNIVASERFTCPHCDWAARFEHNCLRED